MNTFKFCGLLLETRKLKSNKRVITYNNVIVKSLDAYMDEWTNKEIELAFKEECRHLHIGKRGVLNFVKEIMVLDYKPNIINNYDKGNC